MPLFETNVQISSDEVYEATFENWNIEIAGLIQTSQNKNYVGYRKVSETQNQKFFIRVSPDPENKNHQKIKDQVFFVNYLNQNKLNHIFAFVPKETESQDQFVCFCSNFSIVVMTPVNGQQLEFGLFEWMLQKQIVFVWGKFFAEMHQISKKFQKDHSEVAKRIQSWRQIHCGILSDYKLDEKDEKDVENPQHYGVIHGDLNISNFYFDRENKIMNVFDTDQVQRGFYLYDLSRAIFTSYMLEKAGMPNSGTPVPEANYKQFMEWIVEGYESVTGKGSVDMERLERMVVINRDFYVKFCNKALQEAFVPEDMKSFIQYIQKYLK